MRILLVGPVILLLYLSLLITSVTSRMMSVVSAALAAACIALVMWSKSAWLIDKIKTKE